MASTTVNSAVSLYGLSAAGSSGYNSQISQDRKNGNSFVQVLKQIGVAADSGITAGRTDTNTLNTAGNTRTDSSVKTKTEPDGNNGNVNRDSHDRSQSSQKTDNSGGDAKNVRDDDRTRSGNAAAKNTSAKNTDGKDKTSDTGDSKTEKVTDSKENTDVNKISEKLQELIQMIADQMRLTKEQVTDAMEKMGMTAIQLFDPENMAKLVVNLSGNGDNMQALLTDEKLYDNLNTLQKWAAETLKSLSSELGINEDQLRQMIDSAAKAQGMTASGAAAVTDINAESGNQPETSLAGMQDYVSRTTESGGKQLEVKVTVDDQNGQKTFDATEQVINAVKKDTSSADDMSGGQENLAQNNAQAFAENLNSLMNETSAKNVQAETAKFTQTQDIYNQIADYMKIQLKPEMTSMEIQLHPANLGTVNVHLTEKQGALTAEFTTQNEAVKAALESQIVQLKNQFEEQGIKVEAVEVSVAEQKYNQNGQGTDQRSDETAAGKKTRSRRINLSDSTGSDETAEELDDSDLIVADMMARNGNKIDYTA